MHEWDTNAIGYAASSLVLATFCMRSMRPLRLVALASNVAFISYAVVAGLPPILILHSILLPVNLVRLTQIELEKLRGRRSLRAQAFVQRITEDRPAGSAAGSSA